VPTIVFIAAHTSFMGLVSLYLYTCIYIYRVMK